ncbi:MAG: hypothetical protein IIA90_00155 [Chloroflexi bacterium]|nr:hypothetical protein [Chloroflexota bacterium]
MQLVIDLDASGNGPRSVQEINGCRSIAVGESIEVDLVLPAPGVPAHAGLSAYQFAFFYDPELVWVTADSADMLMDQAPGSQIIPLSDPKPDRNGIYISWAVDFGPTEVEPAGASEKGPGVLSRLTITAQKTGSTELQVSDIQLIDSTSNPLAVAKVQPATLWVGQPCPGESDGEAPQATPTPHGSGPTTAAGATPPPNLSNSVDPSSSAGESLPQVGGAPGVHKDESGLLFLGLIGLLSGSILVAAALYPKIWFSE